MIAILSPAKSLNFQDPSPYTLSTTPIFIKESTQLAKKLSKLSQKKISSMMKLSDSLAHLNYERYHHWNFEETSVGKQALFAFTGDVYRGLDAQCLSQKEIEFSQNHLRILSGLYGLLRPMDLIQAYRLEMGTKWDITPKIHNLYEFWGDKITKQLNNELEDQSADVLVNLASNEYFKAINIKKLKGQLLNITFKENKDGEYKIIGIYAKLARGRFARFMIQNKINDIDSLKLFDEEGYQYHESLSSANEFVFTR